MYSQTSKHNEAKKHSQRIKQRLLFFAVFVILGFLILNGTSDSISLTRRVQAPELLSDRQLNNQPEDSPSLRKLILNNPSNQNLITPLQFSELLKQKDNISLKKVGIFKELSIDKEARPADSSDEISITSDQMDSRKPVYAWYVKRPNNIIELEEELIERWKENWSQYGYNPQVLGVEDAKKLPEYEDFKDKIDHLFSTDSAKGKRNFKLKDCYYRYLAMAAKGGGMMVDLDTTPVSMAQNEEAPEQFTLYCQVNSPSTDQSHLLQDLERQSGIPCAVSGKAEEWLRIAKLAIWVTKHVERDDIWWTDMHSILLLRSIDELTLLHTQVAQSSEVRGWDSCAFRFM